jgi:hypothetical protein
MTNQFDADDEPVGFTRAGWIVGRNAHTGSLTMLADVALASRRFTGDSPTLRAPLVEHAYH